MIKLWIPVPVTDLSSFSRSWPLSETIAGAGPPVVLVPGALSSARQTWTPLVRQLEGLRELVLVELLSVARSESLAALPVVETEAQHLLRAVTETGSAVDAVAISFGCLVLLAAAQRQPSSFRSLAFVEPAEVSEQSTKYAAEVFRSAQRRLEQQGPDAAVEAIVRFSDPEHVDELRGSRAWRGWRDHLAGLPLYVRALDEQWDTGVGCDLPSIVVSGGRRPQAQALISRLTNATLVELHGAGHAPQFRRLQELLRALQTLWSGAGDDSEQAAEV